MWMTGMGGVSWMPCTAEDGAAGEVQRPGNGPTLIMHRLTARSPANSLADAATNRPC